MEIRPIDANKVFRFLGDFLEAGDGKYAAGKRYAFNVARSALNNPEITPTLSLNTLRDEIYQDAVAHGLWDWAEAYKHMPDLRDSSVDLIRGEVCELEIECGSEERYAEELADVIIVSLSVAGKLGIDIDAAIRRKMEINKNRSYKHEND